MSQSLIISMFILSDNPKNRLAFYGRARLITADIDKKDAQGCFKKKPIGK